MNSLKVKRPRSASLISHFMKSLTQNLSGTTQARGYSTAQGAMSLKKNSPTVNASASHPEDKPPPSAKNTTHPIQRSPHSLWGPFVDEYVKHGVAGNT